MCGWRYAYLDKTIHVLKIDFLSVLPDLIVFPVCQLDVLVSQLLSALLQS
ncbi:Uncharacterised protein [Acinetobacter baumannii]|nr:Uncharacterised protein [Acinetobacter baumannii]SST70713.1 Uncharacterised protein [Acinetobacter baumannii]